MRRNNLEIEADILDLSQTGTIKTHLVYGANLNFDIVKKYLSDMISRGLLRLEGRHYYATEKGIEYMHLIDSCTGFQ